MVNNPINLRMVVTAPEMPSGSLRAGPPGWYEPADARSDPTGGCIQVSALAGRVECSGTRVLPPNADVVDICLILETGTRAGGTTGRIVKCPISCRVGFSRDSISCSFGGPALPRSVGDAWERSMSETRNRPVMCERYFADLHANSNTRETSQWYSHLATNMQEDTVQAVWSTHIPISTEQESHATCN